MTTKIAVSLPDELVEAARAAVRDGRAASVSAYVADAMADKARQTSLGELLDELVRVHGPVSEDVMAVVDHELAAIAER
jgi:Arc/MetJ-type ribon-helix-helix transcriptional regulator